MVHIFCICNPFQNTRYFFSSTRKVIKNLIKTLYERIIKRTQSPYTVTAFQIVYKGIHSYCIVELVVLQYCIAFWVELLTALTKLSYILTKQLLLIPGSKYLSLVWFDITFLTSVLWQITFCSTPLWMTSAK